MNNCSENVTYLLGISWVSPSPARKNILLVGWWDTRASPIFAKPWLRLSGLGIRAKVGTWDAASFLGLHYR